MHAPRLTMALLALACISTACYAAEPEFQRSLTTTGKLALTVCSSSGSIHVTGVDGNKVQIAAKIHNSSWHATGKSSDMKDIAANPPIHQAGDSIQVGDAATCSGDKIRNIDIDYEITIPKNSSVAAKDGSGNFHVEAIGGIVHASTGSGNIVASGIGPDSKLSTGSGTVDVQGAHGALAVQSGSGSVSIRDSSVSEAQVRAGSGDITAMNLHGGLRAQTGNGTLTISGLPTADWKLETGSGSIHLHMDAGAKFNLDAETGSGTIDSTLPSPLGGHITTGILKGPVNGGGPTVQLYTGAGSIDLH